MQPLSAAMPPSGPGSAPDSGPVRPDPPVLRRCRPASSLTVLGSLVVDVLLIMIPMTVGLLPPLPQPARLALVLVALATLVLVVTNHALRGRSLGGALLGLRAVDIDAGLPPASLRSILAALRLGSAADVVIVSTRRGPDPTQGTLADLERTPALTSSPTPTEPAPVRGPETAYSTSPSHPAHPDGQYSAPLTGRPSTGSSSRTPGQCPTRRADAHLSQTAIAASEHSGAAAPPSCSWSRLVAGSAAHASPDKFRHSRDPTDSRHLSTSRTRRLPAVTTTPSSAVITAGALSASINHPQAATASATGHKVASSRPHVGNESPCQTNASQTPTTTCLTRGWAPRSPSPTWMIPASAGRSTCPTSSAPPFATRTR